MFHFTANLKPYTFLERTAIERFDAYLLSADYTSGFQEMAAEVRRDGRKLVADNGNVDLLRELTRRFRGKVAPLDVARRAWEAKHGRYVRPGDLPPSLSQAYGTFAEELARACEDETNDDYTRKAVGRQVSMAPSFLIGMEDLTLGALAALDVEPEYAGLPTTFFEARAARAVAFAARTQAGDFGQVEGQMLAGLHAIDFDTAVLAGRVAADAGLEGVAVGLFGALTDRNHVDFRIEDGNLVELPRAVPRSYVRVMEIAAGVIAGYRRAGQARPAFHALGAGTPILLPLLGLLCDGDRYFATDSTSPIVDGWSSPTISLYVNDPAPLKYKAYKIADDWLRGGRGWDCDCVDCSAFREVYPPQLDAARRWWKAEGQPKISKEMLERDGPLSALLPFLGHAADDELRRKAGLARVGHNHWVLRTLEREIRERCTQGPALLSWVEQKVEAYVRASTSAGWSAAVREAFSIGRRHSPFVSVETTRSKEGALIPRKGYSSSSSSE